MLVFIYKFKNVRSHIYKFKKSITYFFLLHIYNNHIICNNYYSKYAFLFSSNSFKLNNEKHKILNIYGIQYIRLSIDSLYLLNPLK